MTQDLDQQEESGGEIARWTATLLEQGYCVIPDALSAGHMAALDAGLARDFEETPFCQGTFYGERTKRFGGLLARSELVAAAVMQPLVLGIATKMLAPWCDCIQLNLTQAIALHPGARRQFPHRDQDMWRGATGEVEYLVNVMWPFSRYHRDNGATLVWPRSHGKAALAGPPDTGPVSIALDPGEALIFLGSTLHSAGANTSDEIRRGMIVSYCLGWLKPYENQWLVYPPEIARNFPRPLAELAGYRQHRPNLGNFEGQCPSILLDETRPVRPGAVDALLPEQAAAAAAHCRDVDEGQRTVNPSPVFDRVYADLRQLLRSGKFRPGDRLDPASLAGELAASITPVRDALHRLSGEALVDPSNEGFAVPALTEPDLRDLYAWHHQLSVLVLRVTRQVPRDEILADAADIATDPAGITERFFGHLAALSPNREHALAMRSAADRLHAVRRDEARLFEDFTAELHAVMAAPLEVLRSVLSQYHRRRIRAAGQLVRARYRS